jgi:DNA end-binding protein Ku
MRPIWTGAIGFGLVNIPVKMYSATQGSELNLDMLDKKDLSNIRFMRVNERSGKEVKWENIVKGYKYHDEYIVLTSKDFELASAKKTKTIEISDFVKDEEIDSIYYEVPYYLEPDKSGVRAYALLSEAMKKTGKSGVATFVMRTKESLAVLKAMGDVIVLNRIRFKEEIRDASELSLPEKNPRPARIRSMPAR